MDVVIKYVARTSNLLPGAILKRTWLLFAIIAIACFALLAQRWADRTVVTHSFGSAPGVGDAEVSYRQPPVSPGFEGCPAEGDGGDRVLNRLKNRVDSSKWMPTPIANVLALDWPPMVVRRSRDEWSRGELRAIAHSEGIPVAIEGYFVGAKTEGPEATNCHGAESKFRDWHLWLAPTPGKDRRRSIVVETTPAVRAEHPEWKLNAIHQLVRDSTLVRVSGWLLFDQDHPEQVGKTRGTLWEIHPVMQIEVMRGGRWEPLQAALRGESDR